MLCCVCKEKEATVHLTQIAGEKMQKVDLCEDCAKQKGVNDPAGFSLADLLLGLGNGSEAPEAPGEAAAGEAKCPSCGFTQADFKKAGRLGCAECYKTFADGLDQLLRTMHKGTRHRGKVPASMRESHDLAEKLKVLQKKLDKAVSEENFEQAASCRDEIKATKEKLASLAAS
jgi:protein arginine kinase activator